jgi:hypothetical protein
LFLNEIVFMVGCNCKGVNKQNERDKMNQEVNEISINGVEYVRKDSCHNNAPAVDVSGRQYVIVRTNNAGVFACYVGKRDGSEAVIYNSRRLWKWSGANELTDLSINGVKNPNDCKFSVVTPERTVLGIVEIIPIQVAAKKIIDGVPEWKA